MTNTQIVVMLGSGFAFLVFTLVLALSTLSGIRDDGQDIVTGFAFVSCLVFLGSWVSLLSSL